jgi:hypothetical protein
MKKPTCKTVLVLFLGLTIYATPRAHSQDDKQCVKLVNILEDWSSIHVGDTQAKLLKLFDSDGGLWGPYQRTYISRRCAYVKVDIEFREERKVPANQGSLIITSISRPYLDYPRSD